MTANQAKALRPYFHGLTDEQFTEIISEWPLNTISKGMDDFALHIAEQAVGESIPKNWPDPLLTGSGKVISENANGPEIEALLNAVKNRILSRIKQLTGNK